MSIADSIGREASGVPVVPWPVALWSICGFWAFYYVLNTFKMSFEYGIDEQIAMLPRRAIVVSAAIVLTFILCWLLRCLDRRSMTTQIAVAFLASIPVAVAHAFVNYLAFYVVAPLPKADHVLKAMEAMGESEKGGPLVIASTASEWYFFIVSWAMLYLALSYAAKVRHAERAAAAYRAEAQTAELRALRYQVNPHFLFNTLNSLSALVMQQRTDEADRMIMNLSTFFRTSLATDPAADVSLADEVAMQRLYLDVERVRFPSRLITEFDVPEDLSDVRVPGMILQPLIENAVKHGVAGSTAPVAITIRARGADGVLTLSVADNAVAATKPAPGAGVGLDNVRRRLKARFQGRANVAQGPRADGGYRVDLTMPLARMTSEAQ